MCLCQLDAWWYSMLWIFGICENDAKRSCFVLLQCFNTCWKFSIESVVLCCTVRSARYYSVVLVCVQARSAHTNVHAGVKEYCLFPLQQNMGDCTLLTDYFFAQKCTFRLIFKSSACVGWWEVTKKGADCASLLSLLNALSLFLSL